MSGAGVVARAPGALDRLAATALYLAGTALVALALVEGWQVFARYVLNRSPSWTEPLAVLLMNLAMMLGAAYGVRTEAHFSFLLGVHAAPPPLRRLLLAVSRCVQAAVGLMLAVWGLRLAMHAWDVPMAGATLPQGSAFLPLCVGGALIALFALDNLVRAADLRPPGD
jgi:TRAP-type C4-dicarboxylate transport system permease small subunit